MRNLIGLKNVIMFSAVLLAIGSVSAQQAFAGAAFSCTSVGDGNWNNPSNWINCDSSTPDDNKDADIEHSDIIITGNEEVQQLRVREGSTLFIDCDASLNLFEGGEVSNNSNITNHGILTATGPSLTIDGFGSNLFNSGDHSGVVKANEGAITEISTKCTQPIGGTVGSMSTTSLLVAGAQANMGLWSLALVGMVAAGAAITYKLKSKKIEQ